MQWENLTSAELKAAVRDTGVCIVNMSVMERHSEHLPLGTDMFIGHRLACLAAEREPAVVFPPYYFGKVFEATCYPGALAITPKLLVDLALNVFQEIARNGFKKILLFNSHGGNWALLRFLVQCNISEEKPYTLYLANDFVPENKVKEHNAICPIPEHEHAGEIETSLAYALFPELVRADRVPTEPATPRQRLAHLGGLVTGLGWYADFPEHYAGDASRATREKGEKLRDLYVGALAEQIAAVKRDEGVAALTREFFDRLREIRET